MNEKDEISRHDYMKNIRFTERLNTLIENRARERKCTFSEIVRICCMESLDKDISDSELVYASLNDAKRRIRNLENKIILLNIITLEMVRKMIENLPENGKKNDELSELQFKKFIDDCSSGLSLKKGMVEQMVLDAYQNLGEGGNG